MMNYNFEFAITTYCQAKCYSCQRTGNDGNVRDNFDVSHMDIATFKGYISGLNGENKHHIKLCGESGDPVMHPKIDEFVDTIHKQNYNIIINTNGGLRQPKWYDRIGNLYNKDLFMVFGIDGIDHATNWKYREGVDFDRAFRNLKAMAMTNARVEWQFIIFPWNIHQIEDSKKMADDIGVPISYIINNRDGKGKINDYSMYQINSILEKVI